MKNIHSWLLEYGDSHQNQINKIIHWICVPLIFWSIVGLISLIPHKFLDVFNNDLFNQFIHYGTIVIILGLLFYLNLSFMIFMGMVLFSILILICTYSIYYLFETNNLWGIFNSFDLNTNTFLIYFYISVFIFSWILQFIGHKIEGKKPSFFKDIQFLLIGPAWIISYIFNKLKIKY
tara:strand:+ start:10306 stop:10836 length:531 start_codon:yes stop_codon:yes gene_type:complete